jgi:ribosomal protein L32
MAHCSNCGEWILFHHSHCKNCGKNVWQRTAESKYDNEDQDIGRPYQVEEEPLICTGCGDAILGLCYLQRRNKYYHKRCKP